MYLCYGKSRLTGNNDIHVNNVIHQILIGNYCYKQYELDIHAGREIAKITLVHITHA